VAEPLGVAQHVVGDGDFGDLHGRAGALDDHGGSLFLPRRAVPRSLGPRGTPATGAARLAPLPRAVKLPAPRSPRRWASPPFRTSPQDAARAAGRRGAGAPPSEASIPEIRPAGPRGAGAPPPEAGSQ